MAEGGEHLSRDPEASVPALMATGHCDMIFRFFSFLTWKPSCSLGPPGTLKLSTRFQPSSLL